MRGDKLNKSVVSNMRGKKGAKNLDGRFIIRIENRHSLVDVDSVRKN